MSVLFSGIVLFSLLLRCFTKSIPLKTVDNHSLGKPVSPDSNEFTENFRKGGGGISDPKNFLAIFFALEKAILVMNFRKKLRKGGGSFPI